jgi:membrane protein implicated in regulation of membrane protease activity
MNPRRVTFQFHGGRVSAVVGALVAAGALLRLVLLFLGLWVVFLAAIAVVTLIAIVRALVSRRARDPSIDTTYSVATRGRRVFATITRRTA